MEAIEAQLTLLHMVTLGQSVVCRSWYALPKYNQAKRALAPFYGDSKWISKALRGRTQHTMAVTPSKDPLVWIDCEVGTDVQIITVNITRR